MNVGCPRGNSSITVLFSVLVCFCALKAAAYGSWQDQTPIGGVELSDGETRDQLGRRFDAIGRENAAKPYIVTRAKRLAALFDHVQLAVNTNDLFVHWHPNTTILPSCIWGRANSIAGRGLWTVRGAFTSSFDVSHACPDWQSVLALGPKGLADRARKRRATAKTDEERLFLDCVAEVYDALARECVRWADFAEAKGMREVAAVLRENAAHPPRTFREALQWALVYDRAQEAEGEDVRSQGIFDRLYIDFYRADLAAGRETRESAKRLVADWYTRLWTQQHPNNKNITFGGYDAKGEPVWNELTEMGFEVFRELGRVNPKLTYRFGRKTPREQLEKVTRCLAEGKTSIVFACEETLGEMFRRRGKEARDIADYVLVGCYEPGIGGREIVSSMAGDLNLAKPLEAVFNGGCAFGGERIGPACELPRDGDAFEREYLRQVRSAITNMLTQTRAIESHWHEINPAPLFSGSFRDCIDRATDYSQGGCRYNSSGIDCVGLGTVADSLAAVRYLVDEQKLVTMAELGQILKDNWKGQEKLRLTARRAAPKWGNNDDRADLAAKRVYETVAREINATPNGHGGHYQAGFWSIFNDRRCGGRTAATPEGRHSGWTLSRNNVATAGCGREGASGVIHSNLKLDLADSPNGHILDIILPASIARNPTAAADIAAIISTYFEKGGQCLHLNCFDSKTLREAKAHPERFPDLQVRVCGWNVRWADLSPDDQNHFIATAEAQEQ